MVLVTLSLVIGRYWLLPGYRPGLQAGERYGIDVSNHQGEINWNRVAAHRVSFSYIKATEGNDFLDKRFAENWAQAAAAGISRGAYHFFTLCSPGAEQARNFLNALPDDVNALPPAVDLEISTCSKRPDRATVQRELTTFVDTVEAQVGRPVLVYAMPSFTQAYPIEPGLIRERWRRRLFRRPAVVDWALWQVSNLARVDGIHGPVDLNIGEGQFLDS